MYIHAVEKTGEDIVSDENRLDFFNSDCWTPCLGYIIF